MADKVPAHLYGAAAFLTVSRLMERLVEKGVISQQDRSEIWALAAGGLTPADDPANQEMRKILQRLSGGSGSTQ